MEISNFTHDLLKYHVVCLIVASYVKYRLFLTTLRGGCDATDPVVLDCCVSVQVLSVLQLWDTRHKSSVQTFQNTYQVLYT